jgi:hypothetical protein
MRHESDSAGKTRYIVYNPGVNAANITATLYNSAGTSVSRQSPTIPSNGQLVLNFDSINLSSGYVRVKSDSSDRPFSGLEVVESTNFLSALGAFSPNSEEQLFFPHYAVGGGYTTRIGIVNTGKSTANLTLNAYDEAGSLLATNTSYTLPANGQLLDTVTNIFGISDAGSTQTGYIVAQGQPITSASLVAQGDQPGIMGFQDFSFNDGSHISDAALPADSVPRRQLFFSHIAHGISTGSGVPYETGIALLNPFGTAVDYTLSVYDGTGALVAQTTDTLSPHQKIAKTLAYPIAGYGFFTQLNTPDGNLGNGHVEVTTNYGLIGLELFFAVDLSQLASVPAQTGN